MIPHTEAIGLINFKIELLKLDLRENPGLYDEEKKHELNARISELEKTKDRLVEDQKISAAVKVIP